MKILRASIGTAFVLAFAGCSASSPVEPEGGMTDDPLRDEQSMAGTSPRGGGQVPPTSEQAAGGAAAHAAAEDTGGTEAPASPPSDPGSDAGGMEADEPDAGSNDPAIHPPASDPGACLVAVHLDGCCQEPVAASADAVEADECFVPFRARGGNSELVEKCRALQEPSCATVRCREPVLVSRRAERDAAGTCVFVDECEQDSDCALAYDAGYCCSCPTPWPRAVVDSDPCIVADGSAPADGVAESCFLACNLCGGCAPPEPAVCWYVDASLRTCGQLP